MTLKKPDEEEDGEKRLERGLREFQGRTVQVQDIMNEQLKFLADAQKEFARERETLALENAALKTENDDIRNRNQKLEHDTNELKQEVDSLRSELAVMEERKKKMESRLEGVIDSLLDVNAEACVRYQGKSGADVRGSEPARSISISR
ncbi:hypothetical protein L218DRAFT_1003559 [Marasmius fiardii PR-910]|nr:hypothetical protein L218DRAFT_1003559 [Marasmius fiardii PR-910]